MRTVGVRLWRAAPPFTKRVTVGQITVAGFLELLRLLVGKAAEVRTLAGRDVSPEELIRELREPEFNALADSVCRGEEAGFFSRWLSLRNVRAIYLASFKVNNWTRIFSCVDWSGQKKRRKGSLVGDIQAMCMMFPGLDPMTVQNEWPMEDFLAFIDAMNLTIEQDEPEPMPIQALGMIPGVGIVH